MKVDKTDILKAILKVQNTLPNLHQNQSTQW